MFRQYREIKKGEFFLVGIDSAAGGGDFCCAQFISHQGLDVPLIYHSPKLATEMTNDLFPVLEKIFDRTEIKPMVAYERANGGVFEMERLASMNRLAKYELFKMPTIGRASSPSDPGPESVRLGWDTNTATRPAMLSQLKEALDSRVLRLYDKVTIEELYSFIITQTSSTWKAQAEVGAHDDTVMALAIAWQLYQICPVPKSEEAKAQAMAQVPDEDLFDKSGFY